MLVETEQDYKEMLRGIAALGPDDALAIDTETTGFFPYQDDHIIGISVAHYDIPTEGFYEHDNWITSWYLPVAHAKSTVRNRSPQRLLRAIEKHTGLHVYHHAVFDWAFLTKAGLKHLPERFHDTQVQSWLIDENVHHGLKEEADRLLGDDSSDEKKALKALMKGGKTWADLTAPDIAAYADKDAVLTLQLMDAQVGPRGSNNPALQRELAVQRVLYEMMRTGIRVDPEACKRQLVEAETRHAELAAMFEGVNLNSPKQVAAMVYDDWGVECRHYTNGGDRSAAKAALEEMEWHDGVAELLEYRKLDKALTSYYRPYIERLAPDGRIHPQFSSTRTVTGRFSCSQPNLQTIPRGDTLTGVRDLFLPEDGYELWEYDLSSAEQRVMAGWAGEWEMMSALEEGRDLHAETAASVFGPDFTGLQRRFAKNLNYGYAYGLEAKGFAKYMVIATGKALSMCAGWEERWARRCHRCTVCQAAVILDGYKQTYPRLERLKSGLQREARRTGVLPLHVEGRFRHFRSPGRPVVPYYTALNALVQGGIGEFMKDIMLACSGLDMPGRLCLQIHDSLVWEVEPGCGPVIHKELQRLADETNPFEMPMRFDAQEWSQHD